MGLPASRRLKRHGEFASVKAEGTGQKGRYVVVNVRRTGDGNPSRCGIVTGRRIGNAVRRNRVRRRLREIIRREGDRIASGIQLVIIARQHSTQATMNELKEDWASCARRAGILRGPSDR